MTLIPLVESLSNGHGYTSKMYGIESLTVCTFDLGSFGNYPSDSLNRGYFTMKEALKVGAYKDNRYLSYIECKVLFKAKRF